MNRQKNFDAIFLNGKFYQSEQVILRIFPSGQNSSRFAVIISAKVNKKAVVRNRLRRQMNEIIRQNLKKIKPGFDIILIAKPKLTELFFKAIEAELVGLFKRVGLLIN